MNSNFRIAYAAIIQIVVAVYLILSALPMASAQALQVATGGPKGTYHQMATQLVNACSQSLVVNLKNTSGSIENVDLITGNQVGGAFVQPDVLKFRSFNEDLSGIKTLLTLHPEEIHVVAKRDSGLKAGGKVIAGIQTSYGQQDVVFTNLSDLAGYTVGSAGGSMVTAKLIKSVGQVNYNIREYSSADEAIKGLTMGEVQAVILVGGHPYDPVANLSPNYKLLRIADSLADSLKSVYTPTKLTYNKMGASGVATMMQRAVFVVRDYKTPKMSGQLLAFRKCFVDNLDTLKETAGTHPKWQAVNPEEKGNWPWYVGPAK